MITPVAQSAYNRYLGLSFDAALPSRSLTRSEQGDGSARTDNNSQMATDATSRGEGKPGRYDVNECELCSNRKYQDGSDDPGVSFKLPTKIDPKAAAAAVKSHELEHVFRNRNKAQQNGLKIVSQSVTIHNDICPECGRIYVSGGTTRTVYGKNLPIEEFVDKDRPKLDMVV